MVFSLKFDTFHICTAEQRVQCTYILGVTWIDFPKLYNLRFIHVHVPVFPFPTLLH